MSPPPPTATATATAPDPLRRPRAAEGPAIDQGTRPAGAPDRRPPLRVVSQRPRTRRRRVTTMLSLVMVGGSLLTVVVGHSLLAQGQVRLSGLQSALATEQSLHRQEVLSDAKLETPSRIVAKARQQGMAPPSQVNQLSRVPLSTPVATPNVAPTTTTAPPATASTTSTGTTSASTAGTTSASTGTDSGSTTTTSASSTGGTSASSTSGTTPPATSGTTSGQ